MSIAHKLSPDLTTSTGLHMEALICGWNALSGRCSQHKGMQEGRVFV
jgi:hypothetical protein